MSETAISQSIGRESTSASIQRRGSPYFVTRRLGALRGHSQFGVEAENFDDSSIVCADTQRSRYRVRWAQPDPKPVGDIYELKEKFDGVVLSVGKDSFDARLFPSLVNDEPVEAEFPKDELSAEDQKLLEPGAMFVLNIGYRMSGSSRRRESFFYLRRMPAMTDEEVNRASVRASQYRNDLQWK
jgi:hypothetical protein